MAHPALTVKWDQTRFDAALREYLGRLKNEKVPQAITKKGFFIALRGIKETPKKDPFEITRELARRVDATRKDGTSGQLPIGWVIAAKRAAKKWPEARMKRGEKAKRAVSSIKAYRKLLAKTFTTMHGSRKRAAGFFRIGFLSIVKALGPYVKNRSGAPSSRADSKLVGQLKGGGKPAQPGLRPVCTITHSAQAKSDKRNGQMRIVAPAFQRAFDGETRDTIAYLERELKPATDQANAQLR